jgi:hypothetical protein
MVVFSSDARVAEIEMRAILFVLVAFAHIDGSVDVTERAFIRDTIDRLVEQRAAESYAGDPAARSAIVPRWKARSCGRSVRSERHDGGAGSVVPDRPLGRVSWPSTGDLNPLTESTRHVDPCCSPHLGPSPGRQPQ